MALSKIPHCKVVVTPLQWHQHIVAISHKMHIFAPNYLMSLKTKATINSMRLSKFIAATALVAMVATPAWAAGKKKASGKKGNVTTQVIYTGDLAKKVYGYNGTTPLNITIANGRITAIDALPNQETPQYFKKATTHIFPQYIGKTVAQARKVKADAVTGATYSSNAIIKNIEAGLSSVKAGSKPKKTKKK